MIGQEDDDDNVFLDVRQAEAGFFAILDGREAREVGALSPTLTTLLYLPAKAGIATRRQRPRDSEEPCASMRSPAGISIRCGRDHDALPLNQPIGTPWTRECRPRKSVALCSAEAAVLSGNRR